MNFRVLVFVFLSFHFGIALKCEISSLSNLFNFGALNDTEPQPQECHLANAVETLLTKLGKFGKILYDKLGFSCFTIMAVPHFNLKEVTIKGCMPRGGCPLVKAIFALIKASGPVQGAIASAVFKELRCKQCVGDMCNDASLIIPPHNEGALISNLSCEVSHIKDLISFGKTSNTKYEPEPCLSSPQVRFFFDHLGIVGNLIESKVMFSCFTIRATPRLIFSSINIKGCMPMMGCELVEAFFALLGSTGGFHNVVAKALFKDVACIECTGERCNGPLQKKALVVKNDDLTCQVSNLKNIIEFGLLSDTKYIPEVCTKSANVEILLKKMEHMDNFLPAQIRFNCFILTATPRQGDSTIIVKGCMPLEKTTDVLNVFRNITNQRNETLLKDVVMQKECQTRLCNDVDKPKKARKAEKSGAVHRKLPYCSSIVALSLICFIF